MDDDRISSANGTRAASRAASRAAGHDNGEWVEVMARTVAHLAAQLTITQLRLRALATTLDATATVDPTAVRITLGDLAARHAAAYLRENLGEALEELVDIDTLATQITAFLARE